MCIGAVCYFSSAGSIFLIEKCVRKFKTDLQKAMYSSGARGGTVSLLVCQTSTLEHNRMSKVRIVLGMGWDGIIPANKQIS